ncbi:MAG: PGN_0703 family putative restriction endonuclease [Candidatus Helarchaeota archaeon]
MKIYTVGGQEYRLTNVLTPFQLEMQVHLVNWKWAHVTCEPAIHGNYPNDALLPETIAKQYPMLYPPILSAFKRHKKDFPFRLHPFFNHVASSQAANVNLFLPVLLHPKADRVFSSIKPDFSHLASEYLDNGFRIEFWDEPFGNLNDKKATSGTDSDIGIAYYNHEDELCLWLIEHKLTEREFTTCGGSKSRGRRAIHDCSKSFSEILTGKQVCYYHSANHYNYWNITEDNQDFFVNHDQYEHCPFKGGLNQLWRNQLLGLSIEQDERQPYQHVTFSVVKHPRNTALDTTLEEYQNLIGNNSKFSVFTSVDVIKAAAGLDDTNLNHWIDWYQDLYAL